MRRRRIGATLFQPGHQHCEPRRIVGQYLGFHFSSYIEQCNVQLALGHVDTYPKTTHRSLPTSYAGSRGAGPSYRTALLNEETGRGTNLTHGLEARGIGGVI